ncbi:MAG: class I SAM-dependent methyltransferase [Deltaproteobacteria bacterium]|nr:class I SAM-dependent methyltransferase [Deltaproteobacteria bacterium]
MPDDLVRFATAEEKSDVQGMHEANRSAWNEGALRYKEELEATIAFLRGGGANLSPPERDILGPLRGQVGVAVHLQCASGKDSLSLLNFGVAREVIGVDISDVHVENARKLAQALGAPARFVRADVLEVPEELHGIADLLYTGKGALAWLQDLKAWGRSVAKILRPGGRLYVFDSHPFSFLFDMDANHWRVAGYDYFGTVEASKGWPSQYIGTLDRPDRELTWKFERIWTFADIVSAVLQAGLSLERLDEHNVDYWEGFPRIPEAERKKMPLTFSLLARRDAE